MIILTIINIVLFFVFSLLALGFFFWIIPNYLYWRRKNVPYVAIKAPFIYGNFSSKQNRAIVCADFYRNNRNHRMVGIHLMCLRPALMINDVELIQSVLLSDFSHFQDRVMYSNERDDPLSKVLGALHHDEWHPLRKIASSAFSSPKLKRMFEQIKGVGCVLVDGLTKESDGNVEIRECFSRFATDVIASMIGYQCDRTELSEMINKAMKPRQTFFGNHLRFAHPVFARILQIRKYTPDIIEYFLNTAEQTIQHRVNSPEAEEDFIQWLMDAHVETNQIAALAFDFLSAGMNDSTSTLACCIYELALPKNQHIQHNARAEIQKVLEQGDELTYDLLQTMKYCQQIINETLRKHPVAGVATRICTKPYSVPKSNFTIPSGMIITIPIYAIHHDEHFYPKPEEFLPERFAVKPPNGVFLPFGAGKRMCIASKFATLLINIGLVFLLQNFEFSPCEKTQIPLQYGPNRNTLVPSDGIWLKVRRI